MKVKTKYWLTKVSSVILTMCAPIVGLLVTGGVFIKDQPMKTLSSAAILVLLLVLISVKDKLLNWFKVPSAAKIALVIFIICLVLEPIISDFKWISLCTMVACGLDEVTLKRLYLHFKKQMEEPVNGTTAKK